MGQHYFLERITTMTTTTQLDREAIKAQMLETLRTRRAKIQAMEPMGYVHMFSFGMCYREGSDKFTGLENASVYWSHSPKTYRNQAGDVTSCVPMHLAKARALKSIETAIANVEGDW
jgi:hypothetical protein